METSGKISDAIMNSRMSVSGSIDTVRPRSQSKRIASGKMVFVPLLAKGDLRQWFEKLEPVNGVLKREAVYDFANSLCGHVNIPVPKDLLDEVLDSGREIKFHDFVQLALLLTKPLREKKLLDLDEELKMDDEESTSEAEDSEEVEESDDEDDAGTLSVIPASAVSPRKKSSLSTSRRSLGSPLVKRIKSRLRAGSVRQEGGLLQYVGFVTKRDTQDWFRMNAPGADGTISTTQANLFFQDLAASLKLVEWEKPLEHLMGVIGQVKYEEFLQIFLAISAVSRERKLLKIDDELMAKEDSTSEASSDEEDQKVPPRRSTDAWCPPFVEGQRKCINDLTLELLSGILSYLSMSDLVQDLTVCKKWAKAAKRYPPHQWSTVALYNAPNNLPEFFEHHRLVSNITFMRQYKDELVDPVIRLFPKVEHLNFTSHEVPKCVGELKGLKSLQAEGRLPATLLKHLSVASHRTLTSLNLSRDVALPSNERAIPGLTFVKEFGHLVNLNLQGCKGEGLNYILQNSAMMRSLNLGFMEVSNIHCQLIGGNMFHLRSLVLRSTAVTDDGLYEIGLGCKKLEQVFLENCKNIGAQGVVDLIANCPEITALKLAGCSQLRDDTVFALSSARNLQELDVQMLEQVTPKAWYILASKCIHIRIFHAWGCALTEEVIAKFHRRTIVYHSLTARSTRAESIATPDWKNNPQLRKNVRRRP